MSSARDDWNQHWYDYSDSAEQNPGQNYRRELVLSLLGVQGAGEGMRIIDIGSGPGDMAAALRARFPKAQIMGLDLSHPASRFRGAKFQTLDSFSRKPLDPTIPSDDQKGWATHAVCSEVIEHLDDPALLLRNARAYMDPACRLVITAPGGPMSAFDKHIGHRKHWRRQDIEKLLHAAGFTPEHVTGVGFPFFNFYRCLVILRQTDQRRQRRSVINAQWTARVAMAVFHWLIRLNLNSFPVGDGRWLQLEGHAEDFAYARPHGFCFRLRRHSRPWGPHVEGRGYARRPQAGMSMLASFNAWVSRPVPPHS
jgi:SAM-dependent methyltransferase